MNTLRVLIIDAIEANARSLEQAFRREGWEVACRRVDTPATLRAALRESAWDLILSDYVLPQFSAAMALQMVQEAGLDMPFLIVADAVHEKSAVALMNIGANDYIPRENMLRLMPSIAREVGEARERRQAKASLSEKDTHLRLLSRAVEQSASSVAITDAGGKLVYVNRRFTETTGYTATEVIGSNPRLLKSGKHPPEFYEDLWKTIRAGNKWQGELCNRKKNGELYWEATSITPLRNTNGDIGHFVAVKEEITALKEERVVNDLLHRIDLAALEGEELNPILTATCDCLADVFLLPLVWIAIKETGKGFRVRARGGLHAKFLDEVGTCWENPSKREGVVARAIRSGHAEQLAVNDPEYLCCLDEARLYGFRMGLAIPFSVRKNVQGAIVMYSDRPGGFSAEIQQHLRDLTVRISVALERIFDHQQLRLQGVALSSAGNAILITDRDGQIEWANRSFTRLSGFSLDEVLGQTPRFLKSGHHDQTFYQNLWQTILAGQVWSGEVTDRSKDGHRYVVEQTITPLLDNRGAISHFVAIQEDITARKEAEARVEYLAQHDPLTGLANRTVFRNYLPLAMAQAKRADRLLALLFIDLDRFKVVNDSLGHPVGDVLLKIIAQRLQNSLRSTDVVARLGGDEFAIVQTDLGNVSGCVNLAEKLLRVVSEPVVLQGHEFQTTASIGITVYPLDEADPEQLVKNADLAMYQAKREGGNKHQFFSPQMNAAVQEQLVLERELRRGLALNQLFLHYQPQVNLASGKIVGLEALVRWQHPERGLVSPGTFIPIAEASGLIVPLGKWVLQQACRQIKDWQNAGLHPPRVAVNLSSVQFKRGDLLATIEDALRETRLEPSYLELEVTESVLMEDVETAVAVMKQFHELGIQLAIDDFGIGYSSLGYLKRFPLDKLKIDQSFVRDIDTNSEDALIVKAIIGLGRSLGLQVIAEGVERVTQLEPLRREDCHEIQGYYFSKPLPPDQIAGLLQAVQVEALNGSILPLARQATRV